jgi:hypothetical protein
MMTNRRADFRARFPAIRRVLLEQWDPIGVRDEPEAQDEYDGYALALYGLLARGATDDDLAKYLAEVTMVWMGLGASTPDSLGAVIHALRGIGVSERGTMNRGFMGEGRAAHDRGLEWPRRTTS